jgi:hypothetical protein
LCGVWIIIVIKDALGLVVPEANSDRPYYVIQVLRQGGVLVAGGDEEDV